MTTEYNVRIIVNDGVLSLGFVHKLSKEKMEKHGDKKIPVLTWKDVGKQERLKLEKLIGIAK